MPTMVSAIAFVFRGVWAIAEVAERRTGRENGGQAWRGRRRHGGGGRRRFFGFIPLP